MSHNKERKEKNCLNCNAIVAGRFCQVCGQENIEIHETFPHLASHFVADIFHFDGMFFTTAKDLLFKPGYLTYEYVRGRRASYLNPIKMYIFISAVFFLFFLAFYKPDIKDNNTDIVEYSAADVIEKLRQDKAALLQLEQHDTTNSRYKTIVDKKIDKLDSSIAILERDTTHKREVYNTMAGPTFFGDNPYDSKEEYESIQESLPEKKKDNWFERQAALRNIELTKKFRENGSEMMNSMLESFEHHFPQTLFISLPLFALILQLLYVRREQFYYVNHVIYTVHLYSALIVFAFVVILLNEADAYPYFGWLQWVKSAVLLYGLYYTWQALHRFYGQGRGKTLLKWFILNIAAFVIIMALFVVMFVFTIFTM